MFEYYILFYLSMSLRDSIEGFEQKPTKEQEAQIFKYVKSIWPNYAGDSLGEIDFDESKRFFNEQLGPMMDPDYKKGKEVFTDDECRDMFNSMDKNKDTSLEKFEMATFLCRFINNKELY